MDIIKNKTIIGLTKEEREAIEIVTNLVNELYYAFSHDEMIRFNDLMKASWGPDTSSISVDLVSLSRLLDDLQKNIDEFNSSIS